MRRLILGLCCLLPLQSLAAAPLQQQIAECAAVLDAQSRLRCYDQIAADLRHQSAVPASEPQASAPAPAATTATEAVTTATAATATAAATTSVATSTPRAETPVSAQQEFGLEHKQRVPEEAPDTVDVVIQRKNKDAYGRWKLTLADGQVWQQTDSRKFRFSNENGNAYIKRGIMGAFYLGEEEHNRTMKVKRLK